MPPKRKKSWDRKAALKRTTPATPANSSPANPQQRRSSHRASVATERVNSTKNSTSQHAQTRGALDRARKVTAHVTATPQPAQSRRASERSRTTTQKVTATSDGAQSRRYSLRVRAGTQSGAIAAPRHAEARPASVRGLESFLVVVGLSGYSAESQLACHISLERPDSVSTIRDSTPAWVIIGAAACVVVDTIYAVGIGNSGKELWKWNAASDWTRCADMTSYRHHHCAAVVDSTLYALGGLGAGGMSSVEAYNTQTNVWSAAGQLTHAVCNFACVSYSNSIYVFGGEDANFVEVAHVQVYDAAQHKCTLLQSEMPRAYWAMRAVVWETYAILLGCDTCFIYNFETETWQERTSFKTDVEYFGLVVDKQTLYIVGGGGLLQTDEVHSVSVRDVIEDKRGARWKHHATLPETDRVWFTFSPVPLYRPRSKPVTPASV